MRIPYEEKEWRFIGRFLKLEMTFFDIEANQGFYTLLAAKKVGQKGKVFAFEPVPREFRNLKQNIFINRFQNIKAEALALGSREGFVNMFVCLNGKGSYSSLQLPSEKVRARKKIIKIPITTLDEYVRRNTISSIDFIKIDVEGGELDVLKGGENVLSKMRPVLMCEVSDKRTRQWGYSSSEICHFVKKYEYQWFQVLTQVLLQPLSEEFNFDGNLIAIPEEKINNLL